MKKSSLTNSSQLSKQDFWVRRQKAVQRSSSGQLRKERGVVSQFFVVLGQVVARWGDSARLQTLVVSQVWKQEEPLSPLPPGPSPALCFTCGVGGGTFPGTPSTPSSRAPGAGASAQVLGGKGGWEGQQSGDWPSAQR